MRFDTFYFLIFFALVFLLTRPVTFRPYVLLAASLAFYAFAGWRDVVLMGILLLANYLAAWRVTQWRFMLPAIIVLNLGALLFYKYRTFIADGFGAQDVFSAEIVIPVGISFYVFQMIAYQVDLAQGLSRPFTSLPRFALFKMFFPQLIAGPIVRIEEMKGQIDALFAGRIHRLRLPVYGLLLCLAGLFKKGVLADSLAPQVDWIFTSGPGDALTAWLGAALFSFQIYFDFSGYSDMAIGLAALLGFRLPLNFRYPYLSTSPRDFWRRWHITLSTWIRDYLYISLGGSRQGGALRQAFVLLLVMAVMGLWHGANWTFLVWGCGWGVLILAWRVSHAETWLPQSMGWLLTMLAATSLWVFFRASSLESALEYSGVMWGGGAEIYTDPARPGAGLLGGVLAVLLVLHRAEAAFLEGRNLFGLRRWNQPWVWGLLIGLCFWIALMPKALDNPFIYFRF